MNNSQNESSITVHYKFNVLREGKSFFYEDTVEKTCIRAYSKELEEITKKYGKVIGNGEIILCFDKEIFLKEKKDLIDVYTGYVATGDSYYTSKKFPINVDLEDIIAEIKNSETEGLPFLENLYERNRSKNTTAWILLALGVVLIVGSLTYEWYYQTGEKYVFIFVMLGLISALMPFFGLPVEIQK